MPDFNPARRLFWLMTSAQKASTSQNAAEPAGDVWPAILNTRDLQGAERDEEVLRLLALARQQVDVVERHYLARKSHESVYAAHLARVRNGLMPRTINSQWQSSVVNQFDAPTMAFMLTTAEHMLDGEPPLSDEQLAKIRTVIDELRDSIAASVNDLPPAALAFLRRQLTYMYGAVRAYPITGAQAFRDASDSAAADWVRSASIVEPYEEKPAFQKAKGAWPKFKEFADNVEVLGRFMDRVCVTGYLMIRLLAGVGVLPQAEIVEINRMIELQDGRAQSEPKLLSPGPPPATDAEPGTHTPGTGDARKTDLVNT
jgi:hypothetical protein